MSEDLSSRFLALIPEVSPQGESVDSASDVTSAPATTRLGAWWAGRPHDDGPSTLILSRVVRDAHGAVSVTEVEAAMESDPLGLGRLLPPFAAVRTTEDQCTMVADWMGFHQLYHTESGGHTAGIGDSALALARARGAALDPEALAIQSQLGWQLGARTLHQDVVKLRAGAAALLDSRGVTITPPSPVDRPRRSFAQAVRRAADLLRESMGSVLDEFPEAVLQLTGGQDSRLLLSAVPAARRRGMRAMTLGGPDSADVVLAASLAARYGLDHETHGTPGTENMSPADAWSLAVRSALRLDGMADPLALSALGLAEAQFEQGTRISGLGGEVARGFYYVGPVRERVAVTPRRAQRLADWRMLVNEAVDPQLLHPAFRTWARSLARDQIHEVLVATGREWFDATDALYLEHRMQRWAGVTDTAVGDVRVIINPMLDRSFLDVATALPPAEKARSRFLAALQMELDPELGRIPLDNRPPPASYASPGSRELPAKMTATGGRIVRKLWQRAVGGARPVIGAAALASLVVDHWRDSPGVLAPAMSAGILDEGWLDAVLTDGRPAQPTAVSFITNLAVAGSVVRLQD